MCILVPPRHRDMRKGRPVHCAPCRTRRDALRILGLAAVALPVTLRPGGVGATRGWCKTDPIVEIAGQTADISLSSYEEMLDLATGPAQIVVSVPIGVSTNLVATDAGFGGHGYHVRFKKSRTLTSTKHVLEVRIRVHAPARDEPKGPLPLKVTFTPLDYDRLIAGEAQGLANTWVVLRTP
jgi:hypothetical protein